MPPSIATLICIIGIVGLFALDRKLNAQTSKALWIPIIWVIINGSRPVSMWLGVAPEFVSAQAYFEGSPLDRNIYICLLVVGLIVLFGRMKQFGALLRANGLIMLFFFYSALSMFWSDYPFVTFKHWIKGVGDIVMAFVVMTESDLPAAMKRMVSRVGFLLLPISVLLCKYYPTSGRLLTHSWTVEYVGVTTQKTSLGTLCLVLGLGLVWRFRATYRDRGDAQRSRRLVAVGSVIGSVIWLFWASDSMTSLSCFIMASGVMVLAGGPKLARRASVVHVLVIAMLGVSIFALFFDTGGDLIQNLGRDATLTGRTAIWREVLTIPINRWVGTGYESFWLGPRLEKMWTLADFDVNEAHNAYLEIYLNLGWIGIALLAVLVATGYRSAIAAYRLDPDYGSLRVAYFVAVLIFGLTEAAFRMLGLTWFFFLLGIAAIPKRLALTTDTRADLAQSQVQVDPLFRLERLRVRH